MSLATFDDISRLLNLQHECYTELLQLSRQQQTLIAGEDYTRLLVVLSQKQRLIGRLEELGVRQPELRECWLAVRDTISAEERGSCERTLADTEVLMKQFLELEGQSTATLQEQRDTTRDRLQAMTQGGHLHDAYRDSLAPDTHRYLDVNQ